MRVTLRTVVAALVFFGLADAAIACFAFAHGLESAHAVYAQAARYAGILCAVLAAAVAAIEVEGLRERERRLSQDQVALIYVCVAGLLLAGVAAAGSTAGGMLMSRLLANDDALFRSASQRPRQPKML